MKVDAILLALDNTIYEYHSAHKPALRSTLEWVAAKVGCTFLEVEKHYELCRATINTSLSGQAASTSRLLYFKLLFEHFGVKPYQYAPKAEEIYWSEFLENMTVRDGFAAFAEATNPLPLVLISDLTTAIQLRKIVHLGLSDRVHAIATSEEAGYGKPHPVIFQLAFRKVGLAPERLCMIGDSWDRDIAGALQFKMPCFWLQNDSSQSSHHARIGSPSTEAGSSAGALSGEPVLFAADGRLLDRTSQQLVTRFENFEQLIPLLVPTSV